VFYSFPLNPFYPLDCTISPQLIMSATITTVSALKNVRFGTSFICNNRVSKLRYTESLANLILVSLPKHFHKFLSVAHTTRTLKSGERANYTYIAINEHQGSAIWQALDSAIRSGKAKSLRINADILENPVKHPVYHMEFNDDLLY